MTTIHVTASREYDVLVQPGFRKSLSWPILFWITCFILHLFICVR